MKITIENTGYVGELLARHEEIERQSRPIVTKPIAEWADGDGDRLRALNDENRSIAFQLLGILQGSFEDAARREACRRAARSTRKNARAQSALAS